MINPNKCYNDSGVFGLTFKGTAAELAAVPDGIWTPADGDHWFDTTYSIWKTFDGSSWLPDNAGSYAMTGLVAGETIPDGVLFVTVTATDVAHWVTLPTPSPGVEVWLALAGTAYELRSSAPATVAINGGTGADVEAAIAVTDVLVRCKCATALTWICTAFAADGTESAVDAAS